MKKLLLVPVIITFLFASCSKSAKKGYPDLNEISSDLVVALHSDNEEDLKLFAHSLVVDDKTSDFMMKKELCYRGIPCEFVKNDAGPGLPFIGDKFYKTVSSKTQQSGNKSVVFRPNEWRGTSGSDHQNLNVTAMAHEINTYPAGTVSAIYITSDGGVSVVTVLQEQD